MRQLSFFYPYFRTVLTEDICQVSLMVVNLVQLPIGSGGSDRQGLGRSKSCCGVMLANWSGLAVAQSRLACSAPAV